MRCSQHFAIVFLLACSGCKSVADDNPDQTQQGNTGAKGSTSDPTGTDDKPGTSGGSSHPSGSTGSDASTGGPSSSGDPGTGNDPGNPGDPANPDDPSLPPGDEPADAGSEIEPGVDAGVVPDAGTVGMIGTESCCNAHDTPGCSNADLQVCVCEKLSSCCTDAWTAACVLIVEQKYCQDGIRDCVCGDGTDQWQQHDCCNVNWGDTCDTYAVKRCGAVRGCF